MGTNTLTARVDGDYIPAEDHNELVQALITEFVPRNASRVPTDLAGSLGTSSFRWDFAYIQRILVGLAANNLKIYEGAAGELWIERIDPSNQIIKLTANGFEVWIGGVQIAVFGATLTLPNKYINNNFIAAKTKFFAGDFTSLGFESDFTTIVSHVFTGAIQGKRIVIDHSAYWQGGAGTLDIDVRVNGTPIDNLDDIVATGNFMPIRRIVTYTIPANGNYTVDIRYRDGSADYFAYRMEEI